MGVVAQFVYDDWVAAYPEFASVSPTTAQQYFNVATVYCRNDGAGPVTNLAVQTTLLYMLTSHVAQLLAQEPSGGAASQLVGRISDATEGSVSVRTELDVPQSAAWFAQTKYGMLYWQATSPYRTAVYRPRKRRVVGAGPWWGGLGR